MGGELILMIGNDTVHQRKYLGENKIKDARWRFVLLRGGMRKHHHGLWARPGLFGGASFVVVLLEALLPLRATIGRSVT